MIFDLEDCTVSEPNVDFISRQELSFDNPTDADTSSSGSEVRVVRITKNGFTAVFDVLETLGRNHHFVSNLPIGYHDVIL